MKTRSPRARKHRSRSVTFSLPSAVAGQQEEAAVAGQQEDASVAALRTSLGVLATGIGGCTPESTESDDDTSGPGSVVGDTESDPEGGHDAAVAGSRRAPRQALQGEVPPPTREHAARNANPAVGNIGLYYGNWGHRAIVRGNAARQDHLMREDTQILCSPAQLLALCEATKEVEERLRCPNAALVAGSTESDGSEPQSRVFQRHSHEYFVQRPDEKSSVLVAARTDTCSYLRLEECDINEDHPYTEKGKKKMARSRIMVCTAGFKQNVGHLGKDITVCVVHGHNKTMKMEWPRVFEDFWDRLVRMLIRWGVVFLAGDFNMALHLVVPKLRSRGLIVDCCAWYPWRHATEQLHGQYLGIESCAIFYIGGTVEVKLEWSLDDLPFLTRSGPVKGENNTDDNSDKELDVYRGSNHPGQPWSAYRTVKHKETDDMKNLEKNLRMLLQPSTAVAELAAVPRPDLYCPYLRLRQKKMDRGAWLGRDGELHNGAHYPLCVFTNNARARSKEGEERRASARSSAKASRDMKSKGKGKGKSESPQSWKGKGKGKGKGESKSPQSRSGKRESKSPQSRWEKKVESDPPAQAGAPAQSNSEAVTTTSQPTTSRIWRTCV